MNVKADIEFFKDGFINLITDLLIIHFALIGVISLAFGLVTPPYGLCLLIAASIGQIKVVATLKDVGIILAAMMLVLLLVIVFPELVLFLPRWVAPQFVD